MGISFLVGQAKVDRYAALFQCRSGGGFLALDNAQQIALVDREVYVDRVDLIDQTKGGLLPHGADNVAGIDEMSADPAVEGRPHRCVTQIELGELHLGLGVENAGFRRFFLIAPLIHLCLRRGILFEQRSVPGKLRVGVPQSCLLRCQLGLRLLQLCLVLVLLNREEQVALLDPGAVREVIFFEIPFHSRDKGNRVSWRGVAGKVEVVGDGLGDGFGDGHRRRRPQSNRWCCSRHPSYAGHRELERIKATGRATLPGRKSLTLLVSTPARYRLTAMSLRTTFRSRIHRLRTSLIASILTIPAVGPAAHGPGVTAVPAHRAAASRVSARFPSSSAPPSHAAFRRERSHGPRESAIRRPKLGTS